MNSKKAKYVAFLAAALFVLALCLHTGLELTHQHVHQSFTEDCTVCQHLQAAGKAFGTALRSVAMVPVALSLLQAGMLLLAAVSLLRETPTTLKVKLNN